MPRLRYGTFPASRGSLGAFPDSYFLSSSPRGNNCSDLCYIDEFCFFLSFSGIMQYRYSVFISGVFGAACCL